MRQSKRGTLVKLFAVVLGLGLSSAIGAAQGLKCSMQDYKAVDGVRAVADAGSVTLTWQGEAQQQLRAQFALRDGQPVVAELAAKAGGGWIVLGKDLTPQFEVTTGRRRLGAALRWRWPRVGLSLRAVLRATLTAWALVRAGYWLGIPIT